MSQSPDRLFFGATLLKAGAGGIARVARMTARSLIESNFKTDVYSLLDGNPAEISEQAIPTAHGNRARFIFKCSLASLNHTHFIYDAVGIARAHGKFALRQRPYAVWIHGIEVWSALSEERRQVLQQASLVLSNSSFTLQRVQEMHGELPQARLCWLATEDDDIPTMLPDRSGPPTVLIVGRVDEDRFEKGHQELIHAWPKVTAAVPDARLVMAGSGSGYQRLLDEVKSSSAARSIDVLGYVPEEKINELWLKSHIFAMPSRKEGFGIVYAEAMRFGLPVIASVHDAGAEVNLHGQTGFNVNLDRPGELEDQIITLLRNPDLAHSLGQAGQRRWFQNFRYSAFNTRFSRHFGEFVGARGQITEVAPASKARTGSSKMS